MSLWRLQDVFKNVFKISSRHFQDVFKISSRCLAETFLRRLQNVFKTYCKSVLQTSSRRLYDVLKTSSTCLQNLLQRYLQHIFKTYHQIKLLLLTSLRDVFNTFLRCIYRICLGQTSENLWSVYKHCKSDKSFSSFSFLLHYIFYCMLTEAYLEPTRTSTMEFFCENT